MAKRRRQDSETLQLKLAGAEPLEVDAGTVRRASQLAEGLPDGATEWDLSGLMLDGKPLEKATVVQWLNCAYTVFGDVQDDDRYDGDVEFDCSASGLHQLLAFSDAVMSRKGMFAACLEQLDGLEIRAKLGARVQKLHVAGGVYSGTPSPGARWRLSVTCPTDEDSGDLSQPCSQEEWDAFVKEVASQMEALMYIAHKLRLQPLSEVLHTFLHKNCFVSSSIGLKGLLVGQLGLVFSDRVLDAAMGSSSMTKQDWVRSILTRPCGFVGGVVGQNHLLEPALDSVELIGLTLRFSAKLLEDFAGSRRGTQVDVDIDLFNTEGPVMWVGSVPMPVQMCIGRGVTDKADLERVAGSG